MYALLRGSPLTLGRDAAPTLHDGRTDEVSLASLLFDRQLAPQQAHEYDAYLSELTQCALDSFAAVNSY